MLCCSVAGIVIANVLAAMRLRRDAGQSSSPVRARASRWTMAAAAAATLGFGTLGAIAAASAPIGHICTFTVR